MSIWLSLLLFNPLESVVLFWAAIGDSKEVFKKKNIKHFYILGTINFIFQYFFENIKAGIFNLFGQYLLGLFVIPLIFFFYFKKLSFLNCLLAGFFNLITIMILVIIFSEIFFGALDVENMDLIQEFIINLAIKFFQFLLLYIKFFKERKNEVFN